WMPPLPARNLELEWEQPGDRRWLEWLASRYTLVQYDPRGLGLSDRATGTNGLEVVKQTLARGGRVRAPRPRRRGARAVLPPPTPAVRACRVRGAPAQGVMLHRAAGTIGMLLLLTPVVAGPLVNAPSAFAAAPTASSLQTVLFTSTLLSQFSGVPTQMGAKVFVPASCRRSTTPCAAFYHLPGYGGSLDSACPTLADFARLSARFRRLAMAHVFIDPSVNGGYGYFTDSQNNGPWNSALTREFIPYIEEQFGVGGSPRSRFLEGHSSGGWTVAWLQVSNPDFFRAVWAVSPDPLDFRHFYQIDVTPGSTDNFYSKPNGALRYLTRRRDITMQRLMQHVDDDLAQGGIISSYEFAWSPRGADGLPLRFFDRADGSLE